MLQIAWWSKQDVERIRILKKIQWLVPAVILVVAANTTALAQKPATNASSSAPQSYAVELIVFQNLAAKAASEELWPRQIKLHIPAVSAYPPNIHHGPYSALSQNRYSLGPDINKLNRSGRYHVILHLAWQQPALIPAHATPVAIGSLLTRIADAQAPATTNGAATTSESLRAIPLSTSAPHPASATSSATSTHAVASATQQIASSVPISGTLTLPQSRTSLTPARARIAGTVTLLQGSTHTHLRLNLALCEPMPPGATLQTGPTLPRSAQSQTGAATAGTRLTSAPATSPINFFASIKRQQTLCVPLRQSRVITPNQLTYFDQPLFGVLVKITPVKAPKTKQGSGTKTQQASPNGNNGALSGS